MAPNFHLAAQGGNAMSGVPVVSRRASRSAAMGLVASGWPVLRGTYFDGVRWCGRPDAVGLRPVDEGWQTVWTRSPSQVATWWASEPYSVLLACGHGVDCLEVPATVAPRVLAALRAAGVHPPAVLTPVGTLVTFVGSRSGPRRMLVSASWHSAGSWMAVPPTGEPGGARAAVYRWVDGAAPDDPHVELAEFGDVYAVIAATVSGMAADHAQIDVYR